MVQHAVNVAVHAERDRWRGTREAVTVVKREMEESVAAREDAIRSSKTGHLRGSAVDVLR